MFLRKRAENLTKKERQLKKMGKCPNYQGMGGNEEMGDWWQAEFF